MLEPMLSELRQEAATTRCLLERIPVGKLPWKPHSKSMSLGQLALHVATIPAGICALARFDEFDASLANFEPAMPNSLDEILAALDGSISSAAAYLSALTPEEANSNWRLTLRGNELFTVPRAGMLRTLMLNHWYHHRGQLSVYLRMLDVPIPVIYGRSADENPFA
jgi:uncharacterized damage-inducible protein DinB